MDELVSYTVQKPRKAAKRYYAHLNHLYTPMAITNSTGAVVERYSYTAYGERSIVGSSSKFSAVGNGRGFTGQQIDGETGLMYFRARMYSATQGRFIGRDQVGRPNFTLASIKKAKTNIYIDGYSLYAAYFTPNKLDPSGFLAIPCGECEKEAKGADGCPKCVDNTDKIDRHTSNYNKCIENVEEAYEDSMGQLDAVLEAAGMARDRAISDCEKDCVIECTRVSAAWRKNCEAACKSTMCQAVGRAADLVYMGVLAAVTAERGAVEASTQLMRNVCSSQNPCAKK